MLFRSYLGVSTAALLVLVLGARQLAPKPRPAAPEEEEEVYDPRSPLAES